MTWPFGDTVTLVSRTVTGRNGDGNDVYGDARTTLVNVPVWPHDGNGTSSNERTDARDQVVSGYSVLLPAGTNVDAVDRVEWRGLSFEVSGLPGLYRSPFTGFDPGVVVSMVRVTG